MKKLEVNLGLSTVFVKHLFDAANNLGAQTLALLVLVRVLPLLDHPLLMFVLLDHIDHVQFLIVTFQLLKVLDPDLAELPVAFCVVIQDQWIAPEHQLLDLRIDPLLLIDELHNFR